MNSKSQNLFANVRKIIVQSIICMLLLTVVSCEKEKDPFVLEDDIFTENCFSEEVFTAKFYVVDSKGSDNWRWFLFYDTGSPGHFHSHLAVPINLPEEFQIDGLHVNVAYRRHLAGKHVYDSPVIKITEIDRAFFTSRFNIREIDDCGYLLFGDLPCPWSRFNTFKPINLPKEFRQEGLYVDATFHILWHLLSEIEPCKNMAVLPIEIITIIKSPEGMSCVETRRITGGEDVRIETTPWQVALLWDGRQRCGGSIIAPNFILTARHCVEYSGTRIIVSPSSVRIHAGIRCRNEANNSNAFEVSRIIPYPDPDVDVALIQLSRNIPFNNRQRAINFMSSSNNALYNVGNRVRTSGWGYTRPGSPPSAAECLQAVYLSIISNERASEIFYYDPLHDHEMAATGTRTDIFREGTCPGDSGGALTIQSASGEPIHIGIV